MNRIVVAFILIGSLVGALPAFGAGPAASRPSWEIGGQRYYLYKANLHVHTRYSCAKTRLGAHGMRYNPSAGYIGGADHYNCQFPRDTASTAQADGLDIVGLSDHSDRIDDWEWGWLKEYRYGPDSPGSLRDCADAMGLKPLCLVGFEWTEEHYNHVNVFGLGKRLLVEQEKAATDDSYAVPEHDWAAGILEKADIVPTLDALSARLRDLLSGASRMVCQFNHPLAADKHSSGGAFQNFGFAADDAVRDRFALLEIASGPLAFANLGHGPLSSEWREMSQTSPSGEHYWQIALAHGWRCAPSIGIDNQLRGHLQVAARHYTGVWVPAIEGGSANSARDRVLDALLARRAFATECPDLALRFWATPAGQPSVPMGSTLRVEPSTPLQFAYDLAVPSGVQMKEAYVIEVRSDGGEVGTDSVASGSGTSGHFKPMQPHDNTKCYYLKVRTRPHGDSEDRWAFSAPVWVEHGARIARWPKSHGPGEPPIGSRGLPSAEVGEKGPLDLVFCIDATNSMRDDIDEAKKDATELASNLRAKCGSLRLGLVTYRDLLADGPGHRDVTVPLTADSSEVVNAIKNLSVRGGGDDPEDVLDGLQAALKMRWRPGVIKLVVLMGDAPPKDPDHEGKTKDDIVKLAEEVDPAHVYAIACAAGGIHREAAEAFAAIADGTGGEVFNLTEAGRLLPTIEDLVTKAIAKHVEEAKPAVVGGGGGGMPEESGSDAFFLAALVACIALLGAACVVLATRGRGPASGTAAPWLLGVHEPGRPAVLLRGGTAPVRLGRSGDNDVVLADPMVSARHAELRHDDAGWSVVDLGSMNGTWVEGRRVSVARLVPGMRIHLGQTTIVLHSG